MEFFNQLSQPAPKVHRLEILWPRFNLIFFIPGIVCTLMGITGVIGAFTDLPAILRIINPVALSDTIGMIFVGRILLMAAKLLKDFKLAVVFDGTSREIYYDTKAKSIEPQLKERLSFSDIAEFRLTRMLKTGRPTTWLFELITEKDQFYPVTVFRNEKKARAIIRQLQLLVGVPLKEATSEPRSLKEYKAAFRQQFKTWEKALAP